MAAEFVTLRDGNEQGCHILPPRPEIPHDHTEAPVDTDRSFLYGADDEALELPSRDEVAHFRYYQMLANPIYQEYIRIHKVLVGDRGARKLETVHEGLRHERLPEYLVTAGSALAEAALRKHDSVPARLGMLDEAVVAWRRALRAQEHVMRIGPIENLKHDFASRIKLDIATAPLLAGMIAGDVSPKTCERVFVDCLNIAETNAIQIALALKQGAMAAVCDRTGLAYECNALLAINRHLSNTRFALPAMARCDTGYYYRNQTHDLLVIRQRHGEILNATPVEIKGKPSKRERERYSALLVRGKMHLSIEGKYTPDHTLAAIGATYRGDATAEEAYIAQNATHVLSSMLRDYYAGEALGHIAGFNTLTVFHDKSVVHANHPGLATAAA